jgi:ATP-dependent Clp protease protease subunit
MEELKLIEKIDVNQVYGINLDEAIVYFAAEIDAALNIGLRVRIDLLKLYYKQIKKPLKKVTIFLSSPGGDASVILCFKDFFDSLKKEGIIVDVHVEGVCLSAATLLIALATGKRTASPNSRFMVHELQIQGVGGTATQTKSTSKEINFLMDAITDIYTSLAIKNKTGKAKDFDKMRRHYDVLMAAETYLSAQEAKELGLIDEVTLK